MQTILNRTLVHCTSVAYINFGNFKSYLLSMSSKRQVDRSKYIFSKSEINLPKKINALYNFKQY